MRLRKNKRSLVSGNRGAALVEAAFVLPVLILLVVGMIDMGLLIRDSSALHQVARETARIYALGFTPGISAPSVSELAAKYGIPSTTAVTETHTYQKTDPASPGEPTQVTVVVSCTHPMFFLPGPRPLTATMVMRLE